MSAGKWDYSKGQVIYYGPTTTYGEAARYLDKEGWTVADWGCGAAAAKSYFKYAKYIGIDGSPGFADKVADLREYHEPSDGVLLRHVLEHNYDWPEILINALQAARKRVVVILFLPMKKHTELYAITNGGIPALNISESIFRSIVPEAPEPLVIPRSDGTEHKSEWIYVIERGR